MSTSPLRPTGSANRLTNTKTTKPVDFNCIAPEAHAVHLIGDFNDWHPSVTPMKRHPDGSWHAQLALGHGQHHYLFVVDGKPMLDPHAQGTARNEQDEKVSMIAVS